MARLPGTNAGGRRTLDVLHPARDLGAHGRPWRHLPGPAWQDGGQDRDLAAVVSHSKFRSTIGISVVAADAHRPCPTTISHLGQNVIPRSDAGRHSGPGFRLAFTSRERGVYVRCTGLF